jgi:molecular chaperone GrpE (heat shock protein)
MKKKVLAVAMAVCFGMLGLAPHVRADDGQPKPASPKPAEDVEAAYTRAIEARTADILALLEITNPAVKAKVGDTNVTAQIRASLKSLHDEFIANLSASLTPEQVEKVKDKMTYGKVQFTYAGYLAAYSNLSEENKQKILELLKEARESAMDGGSAEEKTAIFQKYKGRINNYLAKQGIHPDKQKPKAKPPGGG